MKSDSIFYELFQKSPQVFFELIGTVQPLSGLYTLVSQEVKQTRFQIDGVLLPHHRRTDLPIYFIEAMGYKPKQGKHFYQELFTEIHLYLNDYQPRNDWRVVVIYTHRSYDPGLPTHLSEYDNNDRLQRLYLDRMPEMTGGSIEANAIQLIAAKKNVASKRAKQLVKRAETELNAASRDDILQLIITIFVYKYPELTRQEVEQMLGVSDLRQTKVYQEAEQAGVLKEKLATISRLLALETTVEQIAQIVGLPVEEVRQMVQEIED